MIAFNKKNREAIPSPLPTPITVVPGKVPFGICSRFDYLSPPKTGD